MSIADAKSLTPSSAIAAAKQYFADFFGAEKVQNILLEELDFDESQGIWNVVIGFDVGRTKMRQPSMNALAAFAQHEIVPVREARRFVIRDSDGGLVKMETV